MANITLLSPTGLYVKVQVMLSSALLAFLAEMGYAIVSSVAA